MAGLTPQQNSDLKYKVDRLIQDKDKQVHVPTTKGTFQDTGHGWIDTTSGGWKASPNSSNFPVFSVKWGPARKVFTRQGETAEGIVGKSHLYIYFGVDRLFSRDVNQMGEDAASHGNNVFTYAGLHASWIVLFNKWTANPNNWAVPVTPDMYEVNATLVQGTTIDSSGYITPPTSNATYYTGWIETPWTTDDATQTFEMYATYWKSQSEFDASTTLVLYRGPYDDFPFIGASTGQNMPKVKFSQGTTLIDTYLWLSEPISDPHTVFDQVTITTSDGQAKTDVAIAQGQCGGLMIEDNIIFPPAYAIRGHVFAYNRAYTCMIPSMIVPTQGMETCEDDESLVTWPTLRFKGSKLFMKKADLSLNDIDAIMKGQYNWQSRMGTATGETVLLAIDTLNIYNQFINQVYLPECGLMNPVGSTAAAIDEFRSIIHARVLYDKAKAIFRLQWWNSNSSSPSGGTEPSVPYDCTPATEWMTWSELFLPQFPNGQNKYAGRTCIFRPTDVVTGYFDYADTIPDTEWSGTLDLSQQFYSIMHNDELDGAGEGHNPDTKVLELYNFHDLSYKKAEIELDVDEVVIRHKQNDGAAIQYAPIEDLMAPVDTDMTQLAMDQNSIQWATYTPEGEQESITYLQLYAFPDNSRQEPLAKLLYPDTTDVVLRRKYINDQQENVLEVDYMALSNLLNGKPDSEVGQGLNQQSLGHNINPDPTTGGQVWELYQFSNGQYKTTYTSAKNNGAEVVVREGSHVQYFPVSEIPTGSGLSGTVNFLGDMRYDTSSHQLQKRVDTLDLATGVVTQGQWTMITGGQAVAHSTVI